MSVNRGQPAYTSLSQSAPTLAASTLTLPVKQNQNSVLSTDTEENVTSRERSVGSEQLRTVSAEGCKRRQGNQPHPRALAAEVGHQVTR